MEPARDHIIELQKLVLGYGKRILFRADGAGFGRGEFTALIGRNGTGKSTLLRTVAGLSRPPEGQVLLDGRPVEQYHPRQRASLISFVSTDEVRIPNLLAGDLVGLGRAPYTNWIGTLTPHDREIVARSLALVGMMEFADKRIDRLSDGERQRVMIARALAQDTPVILLDEPTAFLDLPNRYLIGALLRDLAHNQNKTIVFSSHDLGIALDLCDMIAVIDGCDLRTGTPQQIIDQGVVERIFEGTAVDFDPATRSIRLK